MLIFLSRHAISLIAAAIMLFPWSATDASAATLVISGPPGASVHLGSRDLGFLPLANPVELSPGLYRIACKAKGYHDLSEVVVLAEPDSWLHLHLRPLPLERKHAVTASLFYAGLGQWYSGARLRGWVYFLGETGGLFMALTHELMRQNSIDDYLNYKSKYDQALLPGDIERWRGLAEEANQDIQNATSRRNTGLYVAAGAWVISLLDAWLLFPGADIGPGLVPPTAHTSPVETGLHARVRFSF